MYVSGVIETVNPNSKFDGDFAYLAIYQFHCIGVVEEFPVSKEGVANLIFTLSVDLINGKMAVGWGVSYC